MANGRLSFVREPASIALDNLWAHKLRSFLTLLGVIIAVTALIGVMSAVNGLNSYVAEKIANFGANVFYVTRYGIITDIKEFWEARKHNRKLTMEDYEALRDRMSLASGVAALDGRSKDVRSGNQSLDEVSIRGATANYIDIATDKVASGRFFTEGEYERHSNVAFIGTDLAERFFPGQDPLGKTINIDAIPFLVVGVAEKNGTTLGQSQDNFVYVPLPALLKNWGESPPDDSGMAIAIQCSSLGVMEQAKDQARAIMRARERLSYKEPDRFGLISSESVTGLWNQIFGGLANASIGIVSVFLVIGGIVIMNIMLAAVTERTREIGIRKSLGARRRDILMQFLVEASVMAAIGGLLGVISALAVTFLVRVATPMPMRIPLSAVIFSVVVSSAVGLFFGVWPAVKASRLDPIVALRAEL